MELNGKVALVTGAAAGIGLEITKELLKNNILAVALVDINSSVGNQVLDDLSKEFSKDRMKFLKADVRKEEELEDAFKTVISTYGKLDIVVNNAGICDDYKYELEVDINLTGMVRGTVLAMKYLGKDNGNGGNGGTVLSVASMCALKIFQAIPIYAATKAGVVALMRGFGHSFHYDRTGVRMMALCPSHTQTNIVCQSAISFGERQEIRKLIWGPGTQLPVAVGRAAVYTLKHGESASVWLIQENKLYQINFADPKTQEKLEIEDVTI